MTSSHESDFQFLHSAAFTILSEGDPISDFLPKIIHLRNTRKHTFDKLFGICWRLEFVEQLRYGLFPAVIQEEKRAGLFYHIDRLSAYLSATCIEIAGSSGHQPFPDWLKKVLKSKSLPAKLASTVHELTNSTSETETKAKLAQWIKVIHDGDYKDEFGLSRAFKKFFDNLPNWLNKWLVDTYFIEDSEIIYKIFDIKESNWMKMNDKERCTRISEYLYTQVRNKFTHTPYHYPTMEDGGTLGITVGGTKYLFNDFYKDGDINAPVQFSVGLKEGISESDIIRLLVVRHLRQWLGIDDNESFIATYWNRRNYRDLAYRLLQEIKLNLSLIETWCAFHLYSMTDQWRYGQSFSELRSQEARKMISAMASMDIPMLKADVAQYIEYLETINQKIADFNIQLQDQQRTSIVSDNEFFNNLTKSSEMVWIIRSMKDIEQVMLQVLGYAMY